MLLDLKSFSGSVRFTQKYDETIGVIRYKLLQV
jgi:hypothetical protein